MNSASDHGPLDFRPLPGSFGEKLATASEEVESLAGNPSEQASWALYKASWIIDDLRREMRLLDEKMRDVESHLRRWNSKVRESLTNIEKEKSNELLRGDRPSGLLTPAETAKELGISRSSLTSLTRDKRFPQPIHISPKKIAYIALEIEKWVEGSPLPHGTEDE